MEKEKYYSLKELIDIWGKENNILGGLDFATDLLGVVVKLLPKNIVDRVMKGCFFCELKANKLAFYCNAKPIKGRSIIVVDSGKHKRKTENYHTILHEIAHFILKHGSPGRMADNEAERKKHEQEADNLVDNWQDECIKAYGLGNQKPIKKGG